MSDIHPRFRYATKVDPDKQRQEVLAQCVIERMGDPVHFMLRHGISAFLAAGQTPNGTPVTVIVATGGAEDVARQVGEALVRRVAEHKRKLDDDAASN
jgi:hypothetical protein